jgi:DNA adenine methylase
MLIDRELSQERLIHYSPLRYPGGKAKLAELVKAVIQKNGLADGAYVEPFCGGAAIAIELLLQEHVSDIYINDVSRPVYAFWKSVLDHTDALCRRIRDASLTVESWDTQKQILARAREHDDLSLGFAMFYLNRTNKSGILNGGIIGGRNQHGAWKIDARYNARELIKRIVSIAKFKDHITLTREDALTFLEDGMRKWSKKTLIYLDPPYYEKGRDLYYDFYEHDDHKRVASFVRNKIKTQRWIVSYDNVAAIRSLYASSPHVIYRVGYSARRRIEGTEVMFFDRCLSIPSLVGPITPVDLEFEELHQRAH